ncbi:MAG: right-handed parallel beta-helix repeat-containing protein [Armatimonadota bacterium]
MRKTLIALCIVFVVAAHADVYYVDSRAGSDNNAGTSADEAFATFDRVADLELQPGDSVLLRRSCTFEAPLITKGNGTADNPVRIAAYGEGNKPEILGSMTLEDWQRHEGDVFRVSVPAEVFSGRHDIYSVFEYDDALPVRLQRDDEIPHERGHFHFDTDSMTLYVITTDGTSPANHRLEVPVIEMLVNMRDRQWVEFQDLAFLFGNCRHIVMHNCSSITFRNCASLFVGHYGNPNILILDDSTQVQILDCFLYENINCGIYLSSGSHHNRVAGCTIVKCASNDGVTCHAGGRNEHGVRQGLTGDHNVIESNVIGLCPEESIDITSGDHHVIRGNICYGNGNPGIIVGHDSDHILITNNICFHNDHAGIMVSGNPDEGSRGHNRVIGNLCYENRFPGLELQSSDTEVYNNTFVNSRERVTLRINPKGHGSILRNNIIANLDHQIGQRNLHFIRCTPGSANVQMSHNLLYHAADERKEEVFFPKAALIRTDDGEFTVPQFVERYDTGTDTLVAPPDLTAIDEGLYLLSSGSPAINAGTDVGLPYTGDAPDLGWKDLGESDSAPEYPPVLIDGTDDRADILQLWGKYETASDAQ